MTIVYCDWATGDDTNGTGSWDHPYKTITKATTGRTGGDEVRVAKSPDPTALTGTVGFTNNSVDITGSGTLFTTELAIGDFILGGDDNWWEVVTITSDTAAKLFQKYSGTTESGVSSQKLGTTDNSASTEWGAVQTISASGTYSTKLKISGGWDLSSETQTGQTYFRQMHATFSNRWGYGLIGVTKNNLEFSKIHFLRYLYGIYLATSGSHIINSLNCISNNRDGILLDNTGNSTINSPICNANGYSGIRFSGSYTSKVIITSPTCNSNAKDGISDISNNSLITSPTCNCNGQHGINFSARATIISPTCKSNTQYGIYLNGSVGKILGMLTTSGNGSGAVGNTSGEIYIAKASISETTKAGGMFDSSNARVSIGDMGGQSYIYTDGGTIVTQAATAGGTGKEWKFSITSANRGANYPLNQEIARFLVAANKQVTVKLYFKKSNASAIAGALVVRGGQIAGVDSDVKVECPSNTNRNQVTLTFTPTEAGVVAIEVWAWYVSSTTDTVIVDDIDITQAD